MAKLLEKKVRVHPDDLIIIPELEAYNLMQGDEDLSDLEDEIITDGMIRDAITIWIPKEGTQFMINGKSVTLDGQLILADGFRRRKIVKKNNMKVMFEAHQMEFEDIEEVKEWIQLHQQSRRNLTEDQKAYFEGMQYNKLKNNHTRMIRFLKLKGKMNLLNGSEDDSEIHTAELLGKIYKKDEKSIRRNGQFARGIELIREKNSVLAEQILHQSVWEDGKHIKVNRALVEKFGGIEPPRILDSLLDVQEAVDAVFKKPSDKYETEKEEIIILVEKFLEKVTPPLKEEVDNRINQYFLQHQKEGQRSRSKMVA